MKKIKNHSPWILPLVFVIAITVMSIYEGAKEFLFEGSLTPWQSHAITIIFTAMLATLSAFFMRSWVLSVKAKEKELEAKTQSLTSIELILASVNHIINNVLNYFQLINMEINKEGRVKQESLDLLNESVKEAEHQIRVLNNIKNHADVESYRDIFPAP
jgi:hypothetical protein